MRWLALTFALVAVGAADAGCHGEDGGGPPADAAGAAPMRSALGTRIVDHAAYVGGITSDGDVAFYDVDDGGHTVAKVVPLAGGAAMTIATSTGTGKADVRFEIHGHVVFAWTDRGNRVADLTIWSRASGIVAVGPGVRPGRAAATADGAYVMYERDVTATSVNLAGGPIAGTHVVFGATNAADNTCWQATDLAAVGSRLIARACPDATTAFALTSFDPTGAAGSGTALAADVPGAFYGSDQIVWRDGAGMLHAAAADGSAARVLAGDAAEFAITADQAVVAYRTAAGAIATVPVAGGTPNVLIASGAAALGAVSPDGGSVLYAAIVDDRGSGYVQPYTDVQLAGAAGTHALVPGATSCAGCMASPFTPDGQYVLELDPIDNSSAADAAGPLHVFRAATGESVASFGSAVYNALALGGRIFAFDAARDATLDGGWAYGLTLLDPDAGNQTVVARGADGFALDPAHAQVAVGFTAAADELAGIWVAPVP